MASRAAGSNVEVRNHAEPGEDEKIVEGERKWCRRNKKKNLEREELKTRHYSRWIPHVIIKVKVVAGVRIR